MLGNLLGSGGSSPNPSGSIENVAQGQQQVFQLIEEIIGQFEEFEELQESFFQHSNGDPSKEELMTLIQKLEAEEQNLESVEMKLRNKLDTTESVRPKGSVGAWQGRNKGITENVIQLLEQERESLVEEVEEAKEIIRDEQQGNHEAADKLFTELYTQVKEEEEGIKQVESMTSSWNDAYKQNL